MSGLVDKGGALASSGAVQGMRLVRVADFSAPLSLSDADRPSYVRRFVTLFVSQGQGHHGGTGRVERAMRRASTWRSSCSRFRVAVMAKPRRIMSAAFVPRVPRSSANTNAISCCRD